MTSAVATGSSVVSGAGSGPPLVVSADQVGIHASRLSEVERQELEADDVDDRVHGRHERRLAAELSEGAHGAGRSLGGAALALEHEGANRLVDRGEIAVKELLRLMRLRGDERALAQLQHGLLDRRPVSPRARDQDALV